MLGMVYGIGFIMSISVIGIINHNLPDIATFGVYNHIIYIHIKTVYIYIHIHLYPTNQIATDHGLIPSTEARHLPLLQRAEAATHRRDVWG